MGDNLVAASASIDAQAPALNMQAPALNIKSSKTPDPFANLPSPSRRPCAPMARAGFETRRSAERLKPRSSRLFNAPDGVRPFRAARLNHLCAAMRLTTPDRPLAQ